MALGIAGCVNPLPIGGIKYTLYRTGIIDHSRRVQWATFDTNETPYNAANCAMAERLLNANYRQSNRAANGFGWWCEAGPFKERGPVPNHFVAEFPTDS